MTSPFKSPGRRRLTKNRILELARQTGRTYEQIASACGTDRATVARLAAGETQITPDWARRLAQAFGVPQREIFVCSDAPVARTLPRSAPRAAAIRVEA